MNNINEDIRKDDHHRQIVIDDDNVTIDDEYDDTSIEETRIDTYRYYHLSELPDLHELQPSISDNFMTKNGYEENKTPRVCFSPSIDQCLMAMSANIKDKEYYVYTPYNINTNKLRKPTINEVPDSNITGEVWSLEPIKVKCIGKIKVLNAKDISHSYKYGNNNTAELWEWEYKLLFNELEVYNVYGNYSLLDEISKESLKKNKDLKPVFVVTTFTSTVLGTIITNFTSTKYSHALISLDPYLRTMYTYDAGGLIIDTIDRYKYDLENSIMCVICIFVTPDIYNSIERDIAYYVKNKNKTHYNLLSLLSNLKGSNQANTFGNLWMMCSEFVDTILKHNNIDLSGSSARNVHPSTFGHYSIRNNQFIIYTGTCADFDGRKIEKTIEKLKKTMEYEDLFVMTDNSMKDQYDYNINAINRIPSFFKTGAKYYYGVIGNKINKFKISHEDYRLENSYRELPLPSDIDTDDKPTLVELLDSTDYNHIYLTSDWHLFINTYKKKRYNLINTQEIIKWCKNNIKENDIFMYLGDISFRFASEEHQIKTQKIFKSLPGIKVLIPGNHDKMLGLEYITGCGFNYVYDSFEYNNLIFTHKPIRMDVYPDDYLNIHGHIHNDRFYKTTDGSRNVNVFPYWYGNKPVTLQYLLDNWQDLVKDNYWLNNAGYGESLLYTDTYYKQDIINESSLNNYKKIPLNKENINKYKKDYPALKHIRENNTGYLFIDNDKLVAVIAVETKEDDSIWGTALEIFNPYKNKGLSYKLLDIATKDLGIQYLSVRKTNKLAIHIYEKYGFKSYKETDSQYFMKYSKNLKESTDMINENILLNRKDIEYNYDKFINGDINYAIIVGFSGSGKSTLGRKLSSDNSIIEHYELDDVVTNWNFSDDNLKEYGDLIYSFFKGPGKKYRISYEYLVDNKIDEDHYERPLLKDFVDYAKKYTNSHKGKRFIIEGVWPLIYNHNPEYYKDWCVMIKGTSYLVSDYRANKRDISDDENYWFGKEVINFIKSQRPSRLKKVAIPMNKAVDRWYKYFSKISLTESTKRSNLPDSAFGIPEDRKYPLDTEKHVRSAIKLFGHAQESKKKALAKRIQSAARKYDITIPENTQCYKYLHEGNTDILDIAENMDNYILAYIDNRVVNIPLNKITWWYIAENKRSSDVDSDLYYKSLEDCAKFKAQDLNNETNHYFDDNLYCEEYVFISNLSFIPEKYSSEEHQLINIGVINVFANGEYEWVTQYPIRISDDRIISPMKESMALNAINPVIGMNRPFLINTGEKLGLVTDLETDKMLSVDGDNTLNIEPIDTSGINEFYEFIGNKAYLNKLNEDYRCNNKVDNLYTSLTGKDLYSIDQMEFDEDNFRKIDKDLIEQQTISKFVTFRDNLIESIFGSNISMVHLESVVDKSSIPTFVNNYNKLNDIVLKEDIDGVYFYSTLSKKRSGSVKDSSLLTENMLKSIL